MAKRQSVMAQLLLMIKTNKQYWLVPVIAVFLCLIILTLLASFGGGAMSEKFLKVGDQLDSSGLFGLFLTWYHNSIFKFNPA